MSKIAFITGITGQDGSYLAEFLLEKNYKIYGIVRRTSLLYSYTRIDNIRNQLNLKYGDLTDTCSLYQILNEIINTNTFEIFEIYNLAAQSHVQISFEIPEYTSNVVSFGPLHILEFIKNQPENIKKKIKFYQAGSSEMYGKVLEIPQTETTPFNPVSPYACAKVFAHFITKNYRESYNIFACNGILFNHESPRRGDNFVTMKIINGIKNYIKNREPIILGNLESKRDWGHSKDYIQGMWLMLQHKTPDDYILSSGETYSVKDFIEKALKIKNINIIWKGNGLDEIGINSLDNSVIIKVDSKYFRPSEVDILLGNPLKAKQTLRWNPHYNIDKLIEDMFI